MRRVLFLSLAVACLMPPELQAQSKGDSRKAQVTFIQNRIDAEIASLLEIYKHIHSHPELAFQEERTSARLAKELRLLGFEVAEKVGGTGVVGVLKNGVGPT